MTLLEALEKAKAEGATHYFHLDLPGWIAVVRPIGQGTLRFAYQWASVGPTGTEYAKLIWHPYYRTAQQGLKAGAIPIDQAIEEAKTP
jgi:hypothetical protein